MKTQRRHGRRLIVAMAGIIVLASALNPWGLPWVARWLDVGGPPQKADAVVLLNGSIETRPFVAAALVHGGWAPMVVFSSVANGPNQTSGMVPPGSEITLKILDYGGVPRDRIVVLDYTVETTFDEAWAVSRYLADHPAKRLMVVTDGPHTRRARWIFQRVLANLPVRISMVSVPADEFDNENWWRTGAGFVFVVSEYFKLFYYGVRYGWLGHEIVGGLAAIILLLAWFSRQRKLTQHGVVLPT